LLSIFFPQVLLRSGRKERGLKGCKFAVLRLEESTEHFGNRTRIEILGSILKVAGNGTLKTHIMYRANLSHRQLEKYLGFLEDKGLLMEFVDEETGTNLFKMTEKGIEFLKEYTRLSNYIGPTTS
jgi:predicted transcriptional regulator